MQRDIVARVRATSGPIVEFGPGGGALTGPLAKLGRELTVVEIDRNFADRLQHRFGTRVEVIHGDFLRHRLPSTAHVLVGCLPFHLTTATLRRIFRAPEWTQAVLVVQWEVARRRAGVGGATLMTAQWAPWFTFELGRRIPARSFTPAPSVDGGMLIIYRRTEPLLPRRDRPEFQAMCHRVFTGRGRGIADVATRARLFSDVSEARGWARSVGLQMRALPKEITAKQWVSLYKASNASRAKREKQ